MICSFEACFLRGKKECFSLFGNQRKPAYNPVLPRIILAVMDDEPQLGRHGGPRVKGQRASNGSSIPHGAGRAYILARLRRDGHIRLIEAINAKKVSPFAVAVELGWVKRPLNIGGGSDNEEKRRAWAFHRLGLF
jgi:hypothetical protein